jgi:Flp pilus assembly protein CpaB
LSIFKGVTPRRPFTLLGIILALVVMAAFVLVALNASSGSNVAYQSVVVANRDLQPRLPIDVSSVDIKRIPVASGYPSVYLTQISQVKGMIPLVTILSGEAITSNEIVQPSNALGSQSEFLPIPSGYVAITLPTSEQQGVANYIQPDDYISVIATVSSPGGKVSDKTIFTNIHVIKVGPNGSTGSAGVTSLTIVVTECQAEILTWFLQYASLKYTLESFHDYLNSANQAPDPACPSVDKAKGVTLQMIRDLYPTLF